MAEHDETGPKRVAVGDLRRRSFQNQLKELEEEEKKYPKGGLRSASMPGPQFDETPSGEVPRDEEDVATGTSMEAVKRFQFLRDMKKNASQAIKSAIQKEHKPQDPEHEHPPFHHSPLHNA